MLSWGCLPSAACLTIFAGVIYRTLPVQRYFFAFCQMLFGSVLAVLSYLPSAGCLAIAVGLLPGATRLTLFIGC